MHGNLARCLVVVCLFFNCWMIGGNAAYGAEKVASFGEMTEYRLENGFRTILIPDPSKAVTLVNVTYLVGSRHEGYGETGMAHLLEHMMFKGSKNHPDINGELSIRGGSVNGSTWVDRTNYYEAFPASNETLSWALKMEADRMVNSFIAQKDLDSEMTVVRNEFEMGENNPSGILTERIMSSAYLWHNYGKSTIGAKSDLENVSIDRLQAFYRNYYQPDNAVLVIAGSFNEKQALKMVEEYFGKIPKPKRILKETYTVEPAQDGERTVTLKRVGNMKVVEATYHIPSSQHPDYAVLAVLAKIQGDAAVGKMYKSLVETGKAVSAMAEALPLKDPGVITFTAIARPEQDLPELRQALLRVIDESLINPPSEMEMERARKQLLNEMDDTMISTERLGLELSEWIAKGDWRLLFLHRQRIESVTSKDIMRVAQKYLVAENRTIGEFIPVDKTAKVEIPMSGDMSQEISALGNIQSLVTGEKFDVTPKNIDSRTIVKEPAAGLKLAFLPKKSRGEMVEISMKLHFGDEESLRAKAIPGMLVKEMLLSGSAHYSREEIADRLTKYRANLTVSGNATYLQMNIRVPRENVLAALELGADILRNPAFSDKELALLKQKHIAALEQGKTDPQEVAFNTIMRNFASYDKDDVRYVMSPDEQIQAIEKVTIDDIRKFHQEFYGASTSEVAMVGDFDVQDITNRVTELFKNWENKNSYKRIETSYQDISAANLKINIPDKENAVFVAMLPLKISKENGDYPALVLADYIMGGGFLDSRLANRIRNKEGLSYSIGSYLNVREKDEFATLQVIAISAPQNSENVERAFKEEFTRALRDGFSNEEVKNAKEGLLQSYKLDRSDDAALVGVLRENLYNNRNVVEGAQLEEVIMRVTPQQVLETMRKYINVEKFTIVKVGDWQK